MNDGEKRVEENVGNCAAIGSILSPAHTQPFEGKQMR